MLTFIVDPNAGEQQQGLRVWQRLERFLVKRNTAYQVFLTGRRGEARLLSEHLTERNVLEEEDLVLIAVGGDRLMNEILDGAHLSDRLIFGFVPAERSDLARGLRLPRSQWLCFRRILNPHEVRLMDYGIVDFGAEEPQHRRFAVSCGCGYDAVRSEMASEFSQRPGLHVPLLQDLQFTGSTLQCFLGAKTVRGELLLDETRRVELNHIFLLSAQIQPTEARGIRLAKSAANTDGLLTVCILHNRSKLQQFRILAAPGLKKPVEFAGVRNYTCAELKVSLKEPLLLHVDGEAVGMQREFTVRCIRQKLEFLC